MPVIMFQSRFAPKVEDGSKPHTIRKPRKRPIKVGDKLSLREWTGKPYRSKQRILRETVCVEVRKFEITDYGLFYLETDMVLGFDSANFLARKDGFANTGEMVQWFRDTHGLPFEGDLIEWIV